MIRLRGAMLCAGLVCGAFASCHSEPDEQLECAPVVAPLPNLGAGFVEIPYTPPAGFEGLGLISGDPSGLTGAVAADLDGDGTTEVLFGAVRSDQPPGRPFAMRLSADGRRLDRIEIPGASAVGMPMALLDLDGDGWRDLVGNLPAIAWGEPGGRFGPPERLSLGGSDPRIAQIMGIAFEDLDGDGWLDLVLGQKTCCVTCRSIHAYQRVSPRRFEERQDFIAEVPGGGAYAVLAARFGPNEMVLGNFSTCSPQEPSFFRASSLGDDGTPRFTPFDPTPPDAPFRSNGGLERCPSLSCGAPMGGWVGFIDEDDQVDLAVTLNASHDLFRGGPRWPLAAICAQPGFIRTPGPETGRSMIPWGVAFVDLDADGRPDAINVHGNDFIPKEDRSRYIGPQYTTVHWNAGGMRFLDATSRAGALAGRLGQWRSLFTHDLDGDGDMDLIVGGHLASPVVFRNDIGTGARTVAIALRGTSSNREGIGATVVVASPSRPPRRLRVGGASSPHVFAEPRVFAGLGTDVQAETATVVWPSGTTSVARGLAGGRNHLIEEPTLFAINPPTRHRPADGRSEFIVRVTPRDRDGAPRPAAVAVTATHGGDGVAINLAREGSAWVARVQAPMQPGSTRLAIAIDGTTSPIHPRLWWD